MSRSRPPWFALPLDLVDDPRLAKCGDELLGPLVLLWAYAGRHETDGHVPAARARQLVGEEALQALVAAKLLRSLDDGVYLEGFLSVNVPHEKREAARERGKERAQRSRERAASVRRTSPPPQGQGQGQRETLASRAESGASAPPRAGAEKARPRKFHSAYRAVVDAVAPLFLEGTGEKLALRSPKTRQELNELAKEHGDELDVLAGKASCLWGHRLGPRCLWENGQTPGVGSFRRFWNEIPTRPPGGPARVAVREYEAPPRRQAATPRDRSPSPALAAEGSSRAAGGER
ncbi:MAG: hypothetical protein ACF8XB_22515 [Planctomycetota bacterium JB042]